MTIYEFLNIHKGHLNTLKCVQSKTVYKGVLSSNDIINFINEYKNRTFKHILIEFKIMENIVYILHRHYKEKDNKNTKGLWISVHKEMVEIFQNHFWVQGTDIVISYNLTDIRKNKLSKI